MLTDEVKSGIEKWGLEHQRIINEAQKLTDKKAALTQEIQMALSEQEKCQDDYTAALSRGDRKEMDSSVANIEKAAKKTKKLNEELPSKEASLKKETEKLLGEFSACQNEYAEVMAEIDSAIKILQNLQQIHFGRQSELGRTKRSIEKI